jgi:hypothetical protein
LEWNPWIPLELDSVSILVRHSTFRGKGTSLGFQDVLREIFQRKCSVYVYSGPTCSSHAWILTFLPGLSPMHPYTPTLTRFTKFLKSHQIPEDPEMDIP